MRRCTCAQACADILLSSQRVSLGQTLTIQIPAVLAGGRGFSVKGLVVRTIPAQIGAAGVLTLEFDPLRGALRDHMRALVSAHSGGPSALARSEAKVDAPRAHAYAPTPTEVVAPPLAGLEVAPSASLPVAVASERELEPAAAALEPIEAPGESGALALEADLEPDLAADPEQDLVSEVELGDELEAPSLPRRLVPLSREASRVILARSLSREGMRADPSQRLARSAELSLALHVDVGGPPLHVRAHVEPGAAGASDPGPWLRFTELAPGDGERLDALLAGLAIFAGGDGPEHALVVCEILEPPHG